MRRHLLLIASLMFLCTPVATVTMAADRPDDRRLGELRTLNDYFPMSRVASKDAWPARREEIRRRLLVANGLWPMPTKTPLNAQVFGRVVRDDYSVERVIFESMPGHFVTGSLYRPKGRTGKVPAVLCPHGHWSDGRFYDAGHQGVVNQIAEGAERFEVGGRYPLQARCVQLARMGCVVFHYDMIGYADSVQIEHRPGVREALNTPENWGFFSPRAEQHMQTMMGLQTWNSVRALDFISALDDVDQGRIAVTGASGGGTQTMILAAIDDRVAVSVPAVMVSTAMQGGCSCENASHMRIHQGNIDIAAAFAPKPQMLTAADDWTRELETKGLPELKELYKLLGRPNDITAKLAIHFKHNYNSVNRTAMYNWLNRHFKLGYPEPVIEKDFVPLSREEASVWDPRSKKTAPSGEQVGEAHERTLLKWWTDDIRQQIDTFNETDRRRVLAEGWDVLIGRRLEDVGEVEWQPQPGDKQDRGNYLQIAGLLRHTDQSEVVPALFFYPKENWSGEVVIRLTDIGRVALVDDQGQPIAEVRKLLEQGHAVCGLDLFNGTAGVMQRLVVSGNGNQGFHHYAAYTFGYNPSMFASRVHDVLTALRYIQLDERKPRRIHLHAVGRQAGAVGAAAAVQSGATFDKVELDLQGFRFESVNKMNDPMFIPGALRYGDVDGLFKLLNGRATVAE